MRFTAFSAALAGLAAIAAPARGQTIDRDSYYRHLPPMPRMVAQTEASARLHLYGNAAEEGYRDDVPVDGIDDARGQQLLRIAVRFAPILRRNNFSAPRFFAAVSGGRPVLQVDRWLGGRRIRSDSILLHAVPPSAAPSKEGRRHWAAELARSDAALLRLLEHHHPRAGASRTVRAEGQEETVMFLDFPGEDASSWRAAYRDARDTGIYAHFLIHEEAASGAARYSLVIQYWFFYPFNDSGNNHEGDWEHLAVLVTTPERARATGAGRGRLTEEELLHILRSPAAADSLVIREVEYYFHESVVTLDYGAELAPPHTRWQEFKHLHVWEQPDFIENVTRERRRHLGGRLATHPVGYIGGNNKGPDELTNLWPRFQGSYNRNGHGTYPFAGTWQGVGPLGATEQVAGRTVPRLRKGADLASDTVPLETLFEDDHFLSFEAAEIQLLPDWERVAEIVMERPDVRRTWAWLLLPIRWGYPATPSPGAGAVEHVDLGQVAPEGPAFQPTWNRLAGDGGFRHYRPRVLRALFSPMTPWDRLSSGWGFLNIPRTLLGFIPGWSVVLAQLGPWLTGPLEALGAPPTKTFAPERHAYRFSSVGLGLQRQFGGESFARMLPQPGHAGLSDASLPTVFARVDATSMAREEATGMRAWINLHYGPRFSVQNTFVQSSSRLRYRLLNTDSSVLGTVAGTLELKEITGGFRYRIRSAFGETAQLFTGAGWGWTWYQVHQVGFQNASVDYDRSGGYAVSILPSARWWPNTWYGVVGLELLAPRTGWVADRVGYGMQVEYTGLLHRLGGTRPGRTGSLGGVTRSELAIGGVVSW